MRTTLNTDEGLLERAMELTGVTEKTRLVHLGLEMLVQRKAAERLADMEGTDLQAASGTRRKSLGRIR